MAEICQLNTPQFIHNSSCLQCIDAVGWVTKKMHLAFFFKTPWMVVDENESATIPHYIKTRAEEWLACPE